MPPLFLETVLLPRAGRIPHGDEFPKSKPENLGYRLPVLGGVSSVNKRIALELDGSQSLS